MAVKLIKKGKPITLEQLQSIEQLLGGKLPSDFKNFLMENNGGEPEINEFDIPDLKSGSGVSQFLSADEIINKKESMKERFVDEAWPIAQAEGGNYICLVTGKKSGIYYWEHESEAEEGRPANFDNLFKVADTFSHFFDALKKFDISKNNLKPGQVKKVWVDPDFKPEF
ncbi:MAG: SMI1/KNR4 family protein [Spirochaetia bacterium]